LANLPGCGRRSPDDGVIGLSTSTNAARVLQQELDDAGAELAESYNIAEFLLLPGHGSGGG